MQRSLSARASVTFIVAGAIVLFGIIAVIGVTRYKAGERKPQSVLAVNLGPVAEDSWYPAWNAVIVNYVVHVKGKDDKLPKEAYYSPRARYRADKILDYLEDKYSGYDRVIGITESDISVTNGVVKDWGVFGFAHMGGRAAVISTFRLKLDKPTEELLKARIYKIALHEFGHTCGLDHCTSSPTCPMQDMKGKVATLDTSSDSLCKSCLSGAARYAKQDGEA